MNLQNTTKSLANMITKNSPTILTGLSVAGLVTTAVMAVKVTPKALQILGEEQARRKHEGITEDFELLPPKDIVLLTWKCYVPAAIIGGITIGCIISANSINLRRNAALAGLYSLSETALKEYQSKVVETIGKTKERKIKDDIAQDKILKNPVSDKEIVMTSKGETLCYDELSGRYFKSDIEYIRQVLNKLSRNMMTDMTVTLNEIYSALDLKGTKLGDLVGWHIDDGLIEPNFSSCLTENGTPCLVLDYYTEPRYIYTD